MNSTTLPGRKAGQTVPLSPEHLAGRRTVSVEEFASLFPNLGVQRVYRWCQANLLKTMPKRPGSREHWHILVSEIDRVEREGFPKDPRGDR